MHRGTQQSPTAVLLSAGLDSAVLAASEARTAAVQPIYVSTGLAWEAEELAALDRLLATDPFRACTPVARLAFTGPRSLSRHALGAARRAAGVRHA